MVRIEKSDHRKMEDAFNHVSGLALQYFPDSTVFRNNLLNRYSFSLFTRVRGLRRIWDAGDIMVSVTPGEAVVRVHAQNYLSKAEEFAEQYQRILGKEVTLLTSF